MIAPCATLASVTDVDPSTPAAGQVPGPALTADDLLRLTGGRLLARSERPIRGAAVDSRLVAPGQVFVALPGDRTDGHAYLDDAIARGAAALIVARPVPEPSALGDVTVIRVADPLSALGAIAAGWRRRFDPLVVGVTGSIAKTSTKEAVAAVLARRFRTLRNEGNLNNEVGLPLTLMRLGPEHEAAVLEMGMYTGGEIADLARLARPRIGVVTAVQPVHLSRIGSIEAIEAAKGELLEALPADGAAILNADDPIVRRMGSRSVARSVSYGFATEAQQRQWQADLVVLVALAAERPVGRREDGGDGLLRRRLGDAPGHADDQRVEPRTPARRQRTQRDDGVGDGDDGHVAKRVEHGVRNRPRDDERGGTGHHGLGEVSMALADRQRPITSVGCEPAVVDSPPSLEREVPPDGQGPPNPTARRLLSAKCRWPNNGP